MKNETKNKFTFKKVYLLSLVPILFVLLYLVHLIFFSEALWYFVEYGFTSEIYMALGLFLAMAVLWTFCGFWFARSKVAFGPAVLIANAIPILSTAVFLVLYIIYKSNGSEELLSFAELIGGLGIGTFGIISELIFSIFEISILFQIFIGFAVCVVLFMLGYAIGGPITRKKKDKETILTELEQERLRREQRTAARKYRKK
ncbi:MAG: hypothetical protein IJA86_04820 [Clostridia bacterium]|nr:hypothetical protein [Clostridia bacterium]